MKKFHDHNHGSPRKLSLNRETFRQLSSAEMRTVRGGDEREPSWPFDCNGTVSAQ